jgi:hypothetical protein
MADPTIYLHAIRILAADIIDVAGQSKSDERIAPELRDIGRLAMQQKPRTVAGKTALAAAREMF